MQRPRRRFATRGNCPTIRLASDHPAVVQATPQFPSRVRSASAAEWVLKRGQHSKKLGSHFSVGVWKGMPIFSLTLPERMTCPHTCKLWDGCFGNGMPHAVRWLVDNALYAKLTVELEALALVHPKGFAVRLHVLGDFVDARYVEYWLAAIKTIPNLHLFGFTAWPRDSELGGLLNAASASWDRFRIRFSGDPGPKGAVVIDGPGPASGWIEEAFVCPAQPANPDKTCGSCGFCMSSEHPLVFLRH